VGTPTAIIVRVNHLISLNILARFPDKISNFSKGKISFTLKIPIIQGDYNLRVPGKQRFRGIS
jgi:hypothetical protein